MKPETPLPKLWRLVGVLFAWLLLFLASPGTLGAQGSLVLAVVALATLGGVVRAPLAAPGAPRGEARRALFAEYLGHALGAALWFHWLAHVHPATLLYVGPAYGLYFLALGPLVRRLQVRLPLALSLGLTLWGVESLRSWIPLPLGMDWFRMGHHAHHHLWLSGSARVFGIEGLSLVVALLAGALLGLVRARRLVVAELAWGLGGLSLAALTSFATEAPAVREESPRLLVVQPGFADERLGLQPTLQRILKLLDLTQGALTALREQDQPPLDVLCWGESMLHFPIADDSWRAAVEEGWRPAWWDGHDLPGMADDFDRSLESYVLGPLYGARSRPMLDPGTWFVAGSEHWSFQEGEFRREVMLAAFDPQAQVRQIAGKQFLCPGAETLHGLGRLEFVRAFFRRLGGYVPDFQEAGDTTVFDLTTREGQSLRVSATLCFDNAFPEPYVAAARTGELDFHLVGSNESWFKDSFEMDHMVAFSRILALATGRSLVRATTSGVSLCLGPDGRELGRIQGAGEDREVAGWEVFSVPVPVDRKVFPPYPALSGVLRGLSLGIPALVFLLVRRPG